MTFQHELYRNDEPMPVIVTARVYRDGDARGSLSCAPSWYCDISRVRNVSTGRDVTDTLTADEVDTINDLAVSIAKY